MTLSGDANGMNWILAADGCLYPWVGARYGWGLGYLTIDGKESSRSKPSKTNASATSVEYSLPGVSLRVVRKPLSDGFAETYMFRNVSGKSVRLENIGIYTPWNDNYPSAGRRRLPPRGVRQPPLHLRAVPENPVF